MKKIVALLTAVFVVSLSAVSMAKPEAGWHKGTYYLAGIGMMNNDEDTNVLNGQAFGSRNILGYGFTLGWNFLDFLASELSVRYGTDTGGAANQKEHAANIDLNVKYSFILDFLTKMESARFLPYVKVGGGVYGAAVPDTNAGNDRFGVFGPDVALGGGVEVLLAKIFYVGVDLTENLVWLQEKRDNNNNIILSGGFDPQFSVFGNFGVHF